MDTLNSLVPLRKQLSEFICDTSFEDLSGEVVHRTKLCLLDLIGVGIAGSQRKVATIARSLIPAMGKGEEVTLWGYPGKVPLLTAVLMNAVQGHAIDMDDGHRLANGHPGVVTITPAIALSEMKDQTGRELIEAIVIGYEFFVRLGAAVNPELLRRGFHTTATIGCFSSGAVASKLLKLSNLQTENALSLSGIQSAGLLEVLQSGESGKSFQVGKAAQSGILAALMAQQGADGPERIFEGDKGFFNAFSGKAIDPNGVYQTFGQETFGIQGVYFKRHAACRHIHSSLDALAAIATVNPIDSEKVEAIEIETYSIARNLTGHIAGSDSELGAKFSTPITVGLYLVFGRSDAGVFTRENVADPRVQRIAERVTVMVDPVRDAMLPDRRSARVTVRTTQGAFSQEVLFAKGEPEFPLTDAEMQAKFEANACCLYSPEHARRIYETIMSIDQRHVRELTTLLTAPFAAE